jgi:hypothetical protein
MKKKKKKRTNCNIFEKKNIEYLRAIIKVIILESKKKEKKYAAI